MLKNSKISIGSANFGQNYGFYKKSNVNKIEFKKIIDYCQKNKINNFDTASRYKNSESFFKSISKINYKPKISTKLPLLPKNVKNIDEWVFNSFFKSIKKMNIDKVDILYFGNSFNFKTDYYEYKKIYQGLLELKKNNYISKIGYSVYDYKFINSKYFIIPDVIQVPFNLFDQRIIKKKNLTFFKKNKIKIYIRSIFLQGTLLMNYKLDKNSSLLSRKLELMELECVKFNISKLDFNLNFINSFDFYDKVILGISSVNELSRIMNYNYLKNFHINKTKFVINNENIIDPRKWN